MNNWQTHRVNFMPAEGLEPNETSVRVLDHNASEEERIDNMNDRAGIVSEEASVEQLRERQKISSEVKADPGYKFLMMVSAFSSQKLSTIMTSDISKQVTENVVGFEGDDADWIQTPEVSGVVHISTEVYGHMKECESILLNGVVCIPLKTLVEDPRYAQLFARFVSLRMNLSDCLASKRNNLNNTYSRLHQEQTLVVSALRNRTLCHREHDWTRPYFSQ